MEIVTPPKKHINDEIDIIAENIDRQLIPSFWSQEIA